MMEIYSFSYWHWVHWKGDVLECGQTKCKTNIKLKLIFLLHIKQIKQEKKKRKSFFLSKLLKICRKTGKKKKLFTKIYLRQEKKCLSSFSLRLISDNVSVLFLYLFCILLFWFVKIIIKNVVTLLFMLK